MSIRDVLAGLTPWVILLFIIIVFYRFERIQRELSGLLGIVGSLKFRVFQHEAELLEQDGVFVSEDAAEFVASFALNMLSEEQRKEVEKDYHGCCPSHIPLWKYFLYHYELKINADRRGVSSRLESVSDLMMSNLEENERKIAEMSADLERFIVE